MGGKNTFTAQFEHDLDSLLEENIKLQEEEHRMVQKVKKFKSKNEGSLTKTKNLYEALNNNSKTKLTKSEHDQKAITDGLRGNVERSQKQI